VSIEHVALPADPRVRQYHSDDVDTYAVVTERFVVLVDTQMTPQACQDIVRDLEPELQTRPLLAINSHQHDDHVWGNAGLPAGTPIIALEASVTIARNPEFQRVLEEKRAANPRFADVRILEPTLTSSTHLTLHGGDLTLELLPAPGHSPDQLVVWIPETKTLLATDAAEHPLPYAGNAEDLRVLRATLEQLQRLQPSFVLPCHGGTTDAGLLARNIAYFDALEQRTRAGETWAFEDVLRGMNLEPEAVQGFYRGFHERNSAAMRAFLEQ
jgi:glyoxylase-like metal-dependent hydrolase (beta-lactamase superfamily II)